MYQVSPKTIHNTYRINDTCKGQDTQPLYIFYLINAYQAPLSNTNLWLQQGSYLTRHIFLPTSPLSLSLSLFLEMKPHHRFFFFPLGLFYLCLVLSSERNKWKAMHVEEDFDGFFFFFSYAARRCDHANPLPWIFQNPTTNKRHCIS